MAKTIQIPATPIEKVPQTDYVRTGCCLFLTFPESGYFQVLLFRFHVVAGHRYGPFKTPGFPTAVSWQFDPDDGTPHLNGTVIIDPRFECDEFFPSELCTDDDRVEESDNA
jgi:hypothetical protein